MSEPALPVAADWHRVTPMSEGITLLVEAHIDLMLESNVWHVRGRDADLVVDTMNGIGPLRPAVERLAEGRPLIAVVTHGHFDHVGGLREFDDRRGHVGDAAEIASPFPMRLLREDHPAGTEEMFAYYGFPVPPVIVSALPSEGFDVRGWVTPGAELTATVDEGDAIALGDRRFEVLHVPGHTPGSIALWEEATGSLFTGDTVYVGSPLSFEDRDAGAASLRRLRALPVRRALPGHDEPFSGERLREAVDEELRALEGPSD